MYFGIGGISMEDKNVVTVSIFGREYNIAGHESEQYIQDVCSAVDKSMRALSAKAELDMSESAVLCAVNLCDEKFKISRELEQVKKELDALQREANELRTQNKILTEESAYLRDELRAAGKKLSERPK